jgi:hypothetical protein
MPPLVRALLLLVLSALALGPARAAESYAGCTNFVAALPATIDTPGTWCLTGNLSTSITLGYAIEVRSDDVTVDCNGHQLNGLGSGLGTHSQGVRASNRRNITVRNCHIRGFEVGIVFGNDGSLAPPSTQQLVEDNRVENAEGIGISVWGPGSVVRRNLVRGVLSSQNGQGAFGILVGGDGTDVVDNTVSGVQSNAAAAIGIESQDNEGGSVRGNRVRGVRRSSANGAIYGIRSVYTTRTSIRDNVIVGEAQSGSIGLVCDAQTDIAKDNVVMGFATNKVGCSNDNNLLKP